MASEILHVGLQAVLNVAWGRKYKVADFNMIYRLGMQDNVEVIGAYEDEVNKKYPDGSYKSLLERIRATLDSKLECGLLDGKDALEDIFTDVELANYIMNLKFIINNDVRHYYSVYYKRKYYLLNGKMGLALVWNVHKKIKFEVIDLNDTCDCCVIQ